MIRLGVNIDHVATVRQQRRGAEPDPVAAAAVAEQAGADSIVCHLREDRRHVQDRDVERLRESVRTRLNLEMGLADEIVAIALRVRPDVVTLVPERRQELTTEGGLDVAAGLARIRDAARRFHDAGIEVSLFIDADLRQIDSAKDAGADAVEIHTGTYAHDPSPANLAAVRDAATRAAERGFFVAAGHGLDYGNVAAVSAIAEMQELNIGFSIVSRALFAGFESAVAEMKRAMTEAR